MGKYSRLTDSQIDRGLDEGIYREDGILIRNRENGETVKVRSQRGTGGSVFPSTFLQVNNVTVYQSDLTPVYSAILESRTTKNFQDLEEAYGLVLEYFESYVKYGDMLPDLLKQCMGSSVSFDNKMRTFAKGLDLDALDELDLEPLLGAISANINLIFIYISASYLSYGEKFKSDERVIAKILSLREVLKGLYEQLLATSSFDKEKNVHHIELKGSLYLRYMMDTGYDARDLEETVRHDRRFSSIGDLLDFFKRCYVKEELERGLWNPTKFKIDIEPLPMERKGNRAKLVRTLIDNLNDLEKLERFRGEVPDLGEDEELHKFISSGMRFEPKDGV
ncbi:hypothetical protein [Pseudomonas reinekei]